MRRVARCSAAARPQNIRHSEARRSASASRLWHSASSSQPAAMRPEKATPPACAPADSNAPARPANTATRETPSKPSRTPAPRRGGRGLSTPERDSPTRCDREHGRWAAPCPRGAGAVRGRAEVTRAAASRAGAGNDPSSVRPTSDDTVAVPPAAVGGGAAAPRPRRRQREPSRPSFALDPPFLRAHTRIPPSLITQTERLPTAHLDAVSRRAFQFGTTFFASSRCGCRRPGPECPTRGCRPPSAAGDRRIRLGRPLSRSRALFCGRPRWAAALACR